MPRASCHSRRVVGRSSHLSNALESELGNPLDDKSRCRDRWSSISVAPNLTPSAKLLQQSHGADPDSCGSRCSSHGESPSLACVIAASVPGLRGYPPVDMVREATFPLKALQASPPSASVRSVAAPVPEVFP